MFLCLIEMFLFKLPSVNKWARWHTLVSLDSYIANQSRFSSINDKDLNSYKNLRNLWVPYGLYLQENTNELLSMDRFAKNLITHSPVQEKTVNHLLC